MTSGFMGTRHGAVAQTGEEQEALHATSSTWEHHSRKQDPLLLGETTFYDLILGTLYHESVSSQPVFIKCLLYTLL